MAATEITTDRAKQPQVIEARFWSKVRKGNGCWIWQGYTLPSGYGQFTRAGKHECAHRAAWEFTNGPIPEGMQVCHHCDNPPCVRPDHLFLGTQKDNMADAVSKGRMACGDRSGPRLHPERMRRGERNGRAKLTESNVLEIRALQGTLSRTQIAAMFGVSRTLIRFIQDGRRWKGLV